MPDAATLNVAVAPTFTDWLAACIDEVAGLDRPLLVADLKERGIDLR